MLVAHVTSSKHMKMGAQVCTVRLASSFVAVAFKHVAKTESSCAVDDFAHLRPNSMSRFLRPLVRGEKDVDEITLKGNQSCTQQEGSRYRASLCLDPSVCLS